MMMNYIYDGSFEGLLTAIYEAYYRHQEPHSIIRNGNNQLNLFDENTLINTDTNKADKVYKAIRDKISPASLENAYYVYLSEEYEAGTIIYNYLKLGWKFGSKIDEYLSNDWVLKVTSINRKVGGEKHRLTGLLRFKQIDGNIYYASIEPDSNIVELLAPHFADRLADQNWIIHDIKRKIAAVYNCSEWVIADAAFTENPAITSSESDYQRLWKQYFKSIAIPYRINPKLQRSHMPARYWKHLVEKQLPD